MLSEEKRESHISCRVDRNFEGNYVVFEQIIIKNGAEEIVGVGSLAFTCDIAYGKGLLGVLKKS